MCTAVCHRERTLVRSRGLEIRQQLEQLADAYAVSEAEKLMDSLSIGSSRVAQLAREATASQMNVGMTRVTREGTARGVRGISDACVVSVEQSEGQGSGVKIQSSVLVRDARCLGSQVLT